MISSKLIQLLNVLDGIYVSLFGKVTFIKLVQFEKIPCPIETIEFGKLISCKLVQLENTLEPKFDKF